MVSADGSPVTPDDPQDPRGNKPGEVKKPAETAAAKTDPPAPVASYIREPKRPATPKPPVPAPPVADAIPETGNGEQPPTDENVAEQTPVAETQVQPKPKAGKKKKKQKPPRRERKISRLVMEFQPDAVEMEHRKVAGGLRWTLYTAILLLIAAIAWAWWAKVDRVVMAEGKLIATERPIAITTSQTGPIKTTFEVKFGDTVKAGQQLVTLDPTFSEADVKKLETRLNALGAETSRLKAEQQEIDFVITGHENDPVWINQQILFIDRKRQMDASQEQYEAEILKLNAQKEKHLAEVNSRTDLVVHRTEDLRKAKALEKTGAGTLDERRNAEIELKYAKNNLITAQKTVAETDSQFVVLKKQHETTMAKDQATVSLELAQKRQQLNEVEEDLNKARRANELVVIYAPTEHAEYKVIEIADPSTVANPGQPIMKLLPVNSPLELEVKVQSKDIALIRDSQDGKPRDVRIKISAFPYMKHGTLNGYVRTINEDITELGQPGMSQSFYLVRVRFDDSEDAPTLRDIPDGDERFLRPGMAATAEIKVGRRRVIDFFIYPLFRSLDTSIREP